MSVKHLYLVAVAAIIGCAPAGGTSGTSGASAAPRRADYLTAEEIVAADGQPYGDLNSLRNIPAYDVGDVRYYDVTQAGARFGVRGGPGGVIEVRMKSPRRARGLTKQGGR